MSTKKLMILFDASILSSGALKNANRSGIYFCAYNILIEFLKRDDTEIHIYAGAEHVSKVATILNELPPELYNKIIFTNTFNYKKRLTFVQNKWDEMTRKINTTRSFPEKFLCRTVRKSCHLILKYYNRLTPLDSLEGYDCFFSPCYAIPKGIARSNIPKFTLLYDTICLKYPHFFEAMKHEFWYKDLVKQLNKNDYYFAISECTRKDFIELETINPDKIWTTLLAASNKYYVCKDTVKIDATREKYNIPSDKSYALSLCSIEPRKNLIFAAKGFVEFLKRGNVDDLVFVLGGAHWDDFITILEQEVSNFDSYKGKIIRAGYIDDDDLAPLYSGAKFFIYPSLYEGFGLPILEAMKCGTPVITSNRSSIPEVAGDAAIMIDPNNIKEFVDAMENIYYNEALRIELVKKGIGQSQKFSWYETANKMVNKIRLVANAH